MPNKLAIRVEKIVGELLEAIENGRDHRVNLRPRARVCVRSSWYIEWPHVDGRFVALYRTLAGV